MELIKAILNQILLFFDDTCEHIKGLTNKGRRRLIIFCSSFLCIVTVLIIVLVFSSHSERTSNTLSVEAVIRNRVRIESGTLGSGEDMNKPERYLSSEAYPVSTPDNLSITWPSADDVSPDTFAESTDDYSTPDLGQEPETYPENSEEPAESPELLEETPEPTEELTEKYVSLKKHDKSEAVTTLQYRLMELGYLDIDEPTNYFGSITETALILFQRQHDLKQDGIAGNETQTILYGESAQRYCLKEGAEGQDVKALQEQLVDLGYMSEQEVDRVYGAVTIAAVEAFQKRNGLHVDGLAGEKTLELLYSEKAVISRDLQKKQEAEAAAEKKAAEEAKKKAEAEAKKAAEAAKKAKATAKPTKKPSPTPKKDTRIDKFIAAANSRIGCEYVLGARGPNKFDCSGLVYYCLRKAGVGGTRLNAAGYSQRSGWKKITSINSLKKGDILFFRSDTNSSVNHTGIYVGGGNMIDASSGNGKVVKRPLSAYWKRNFVCARRPWS